MGMRALSYLSVWYLNAGLAVKSQTLHSKLQFLLGHVPIGVWPGLSFFILECGFLSFIFGSVVRFLLCLYFWFSLFFFR